MPDKFCPECQAEREEGVFCHRCGTKLNHQQKCTCGNMVRAGAKYCVKCGKKRENE